MTQINLSNFCIVRSKTYVFFFGIFTKIWLISRSNGINGETHVEVGFSMDKRINAKQTSAQVANFHYYKDNGELFTNITSCLHWKYRQWRVRELQEESPARPWWGGAASGQTERSVHWAEGHSRGNRRTSPNPLTRAECQRGRKTVELCRLHCVKQYQPIFL